VSDPLADYVAGSGVLAAAELDPAGIIVRANATLERLAGGPLAGHALRELVSPEQHEALARLLTATGPGWQRATLGLAPDDRGVPRDFAIACRADGDRRLVVAEPLAGTVAAVDERILALNVELTRAQREISRQNASLRELDRLKDALVANVSHDLRTPLTAILGYAELLRRRGGLTDKQAQAVDVIERNARRLLRLVNDLLVLAQTRAGMLTLDREPVDLVQLATDAVELTAPLAEHAGVRLALELAADSATVDGDPFRLAQLLDNLLANAVKFTPAGGAVTVRVDGTALEVSDTGPGIPAEERERLFEAFARGGGSDAPGTGLGLTIVRAIADAHGASVEVDTEPGRGTRFRVGFTRR
jgi:signal transduction histidine kinase